MLGRCRWLNDRKSSLQMQSTVLPYGINAMISLYPWVWPTDSAVIHITLNSAS